MNIVLCNCVRDTFPFGDSIDFKRYLFIPPSRPLKGESKERRMLRNEYQEQTQSVHP